MAINLSKITLEKHGDTRKTDLSKGGDNAFKEIVINSKWTQKKGFWASLTGSADAGENVLIDTQGLSDLKRITVYTFIKEEAEFIFELNDAVSGKENHVSWKTFFVNSITSYILEDETSPDEIYDDKAQWLLSKIRRDGQLDKIERVLLANLKSNDKNFPEILN
jgi:hypothetical protein